MSTRLARVAYLAKYQPYRKLPYPVCIPTVRRLGYKTGLHFTVYGTVKKGNKRHPLPKKGRSSRGWYSWYSSKLSGCQIAMQRAVKRHPGHTVVNAYYVLHHGGKNYYEVVLTR